MRIEHDSMGEVEVPDDARWGAQTQRAIDNFPISGEPIDRRLIAALAAIKGAGATVNARLGVIDKDMAKAIHDAAADVSRGGYDGEFPLDVFQTGSGTSSNMNMNEVIANARVRAARTAERRPSERPRQRVAVVERRVPVGDPHRNCAIDHRGVAAVARSVDRRAAEEVA